MPPISKPKRDKISEQILQHLYSISPEPAFTAHIASEIARDEEFTKSLLQELEKNNIIIKINKSPSGLKYIRRERWRLSSKAYEFYKSRIHNN